MFLPVLPYLFTRHLVPDTPNVRPSYKSIQCRVTDIPLEKPTPVHPKGRCGAHCWYHVLWVVYRQSPWNRSCREATRHAPRFRPRVGDGL